MSWLVSDAATVALKLAGFLEGGVQRGFLDGAPEWWANEIRRRLRQIDALTAPDAEETSLAVGDWRAR